MLGYQAEAEELPHSSTFPMLPPVEGHVITVDMVEDALVDE